MQKESLSHSLISGRMLDGSFRPRTSIPLVNRKQSSFADEPRHSVIQANWDLTTLPWTPLAHSILIRNTKFLEGQQTTSRIEPTFCSRRSGDSSRLVLETSYGAALRRDEQENKMTDAHPERPASHRPGKRIEGYIARKWIVPSRTINHRDNNLTKPTTSSSIFRS